MLNVIYTRKVLDYVYQSDGTAEKAINTLHSKIKYDMANVLKDETLDGLEKDFRLLVLRQYLEVITYIETYSLGVQACVYNLEQALRSEIEYIKIDCEEMA